MERRSSAIWRGNMKNGKGELRTESGVLDNTPYSFSTRFGEQRGVNPEELVAAAHAGCYNMALAGLLEKKGYNPDYLETTATVTVGKEGEGYGISSSKLKLRANVPDADESTFRKLAEDAKRDCVISKALSVDISLDVEFQQSLHSSTAPH